jgi:general secretion pathway protein B
MSLLLDALNKADQERKRNQTVPGIDSQHKDTKAQGAPANSRRLLALGILGLSILLASLFWLARQAPASITASAQGAVSTLPQGQASSSPATNATEQIKEFDVHSSALSGAEIPAADIATEASVADLYQQNARGAPNNASVTVSRPNGIESESLNASQTSMPEGAALTSITQFANLPELHDLPNNILMTIPSLSYTEHNANSQGGSVKLNGLVLHSNEQIVPGLFIDRILDDGIILHIDNYAFKIRALNSWVNM